MAQSHDFPLGSFGGDLKTGRQSLSLHDQRMVACSVKGIGQLMEDRFPVVPDLRRFAMHQPFSSNDITAKCYSQRLMAEADAQKWKTPAKMPDGLDRHARFYRCAGSRRNDDAAGLQRFDLIDRNFVVAEYPNVFTQLPEVLHQVIGEGVIVVDHQ